MSEKPLGDRAKSRLRIAAGLMRGVGRNAVDLNIPRDKFYDEIQLRIAALEPAERDRLRQLTDWVEEYDAATQSGKSPSLPPEGKLPQGGARRGDGTSPGDGVQPHGKRS